MSRWRTEYNQLWVDFSQMLNKLIHSPIDYLFFFEVREGPPPPPGALENQLKRVDKKKLKDPFCFISRHQTRSATEDLLNYNEEEGGIFEEVAMLIEQVKMTDPKRQRKYAKRRDNVG
jgi:hypothetical protein